MTDDRNGATNAEPVPDVCDIRHVGLRFISLMATICSPLTDRAHVIDLMKRQNIYVYIYIIRPGHGRDS